MRGTQRSDSCCFAFTSLLVEWREGALRPSVPDQVGPWSHLHGRLRGDSRTAEMLGSQ